ncbi:MAG: hypothetical protein C6I01_00860, partial [Epsilonproteobacteria bacterium]|nr:hypothetical protein [Campylobacterota bacterium]
KISKIGTDRLGGGRKISLFGVLCSIKEIKKRVPLFTFPVNFQKEMQIGEVLRVGGKKTPLSLRLFGEIIGSLAGKWEENILFWAGKEGNRKIADSKKFSGERIEKYFFVLDLKRKLKFERWSGKYFFGGGNGFERGLEWGKSI